jgi:hypothetical protein
VLCCVCMLCSLQAWCVCAGLCLRTLLDHVALWPDATVSPHRFCSACLLPAAVLLPRPRTAYNLFTTSRQQLAKDDLGPGATGSDIMLRLAGARLIGRGVGLGDCESTECVLSMAGRDGEYQ